MDRPLDRIPAMRWVALLGACTVACSFRPPGVAPGDTVEDAAPAVDAPAVDAPAVDAPIVDAPVPAATCHASTTTTAAGWVGGTSGNTRQPLRCASDEIAVALELEMTDGPDWANRYASARATLTCARLARPAGGTYQATPGASLVANADPCNPFVPPVSTGTTACAAGSVIVGLRAAAIPTTPPTCFGNVTVLCAPIDAAGTPSATHDALPIAGSVNADLTPIAVVCPAGQALLGVRPNDGCGLDGLELLCGPVTCD